MALTEVRGWLVTYDIANPRRLLRVHRYMRKVAVPVQYSVFYFEGSPLQMQALMKGVEQIINPARDDVRGYALPNPGQVQVLGRGAIASEVLLLSATSEALRTLLMPGHSSQSHLVEG